MARSRTTRTPADEGNAAGRKEAQANEPEVSKAEAIRQYKAAHPEAKAKEIAAALTQQGVEVTAGRVSSVLRGPSGRNKVDVETIRKASVFVQQYPGKLDEAVSAIEAVGQFIAECGGAEKAKAALEAFRAVSEAVGPPKK